MRRLALLVAVALGGVILSGNVAAQDGRSIFSALDTQGRTVALGEEMSGDLTAGDVLSAGGRRVQVWTLGASQGQEVQVDLRSDDFDPFLYVVGPGLSEGLRDDDGGSGLNSRICFVPDQPGEYRVVASSLNAGTGSFSISAFSAEGSCGGVSVTSEVDDLSTLPTEGRYLEVGDLEVLGTLTEADATFYDSPVQAWAVQGTAGSPFSVDLVSDDFDAFLTLLGPGLDEWIDDDDGAGRCDARISLTFPESGEYMVVVSTLGAGAGDFRLSASEQPEPPDPLSCDPFAFEEASSGGYEYAIGSLDEVSMVGSLAMEQLASGTMQGDEGHFRDRPLQGWVLEGMAGNRVAITLVSDQFDTYLFFDGPGFIDPLSDDDSAGDLDSRICVELPESGSYRVFAGPLSSVDAGSRYSLEATVRDAADVCTSYELSPAAAAEELSALSTEGRTIGLDEEQTGTLNGDVRHPESGRPVQPWTLRAPAGTFLYVDVVTQMFDAYLYVMGGGLGEVLTADDFGGTLNPRLGLTMPASGEVMLLPSGFGESARGDFLLRVSTDPPPMGSSEGATGTSGTMTDLDDIQGIGLPVGELPLGAELTGVLGEGDDVISRGYAQAFTFEGTAGQEVAFEVVADFDTYMYLTGPGITGVLSDDDSAGSLDARIQLTLPGSGTYTVIASALGEGTTGEFRVRAFRVVR